MVGIIDLSRRNEQEETGDKERTLKKERPQKKFFRQQRAISVKNTKNWLKENFEHVAEMRTELLGSAPDGQREHLGTYSLYPQRSIGM